MTKLHELLNMEISEDEERQLSPKANAYVESAGKRDVARIDFNSKMAVLCAGSIAVLASGVVAVVNSTTLQPLLPTNFVVYVIFASSCLWLSLVCCTIHNYFEIALLEHDSESKNEDTILAIADIYMKQKGFTEEDRKKEIARSPIKKDAGKRTHRGIIMRRIQRHLTLAGVVLFCIGYLAVVVFICIVASSV
jgi:hypothetical protein